MKYGELNLGQIEAAVNKLGGMDGVRRLLSGDLVVKAVGLLKRVATAHTPAVKRFVARDHLADCNIGWTGENFKSLFLDKVYKDVGEEKLAIHRLEKASLDAPILYELGERPNTSIAHLFSLIKRQKNGEKGDLLTNGYVNIVYDYDDEGNFWAVIARWRSGDGSWDVEASSVEDRDGWFAGYQVVSCDS